MPEISRFYGIIIRMYFADHNPPHFHAHFGEHEVLIDIQDLTVIKGKFPKHALELTFKWAELHKDELMEDWQLANQLQPLNKIAPLD